MGEIWLSNGMWLFLFVLFVLTLWITFAIFRKEEKKLDKLAAEGDSVQNEIERSLQYETKSITYNVKRLAWIYAITIPLSLIIFFVYFYYISR